MNSSIIFLVAIRSLSSWSKGKIVAPPIIINQSHSSIEQSEQFKQRENGPCQQLESQILALIAKCSLIFVSIVHLSFE